MQGSPEVPPCAVWTVLARKNALKKMSVRATTGPVRPVNCLVFDVKLKYLMSFPFPQKLILINQHILLNHHLFAPEVHLSRLLVYFLIELKIK